MGRCWNFSNSSQRWKARRVSRDQHLERGNGGAERGIVFLQVLYFAILGMLLSSLLVSGLFNQSLSMRRVREAPQVFYSAESGIQYTVQHLINAVSEEDDAIKQFNVIAAYWNQPQPFADTVGHVSYEARIVDVTPNLAFRAFVQKYADVTIEAEARETGMPSQVLRATYRLWLGPVPPEGQRATRVLWQRS